MNPSTFTCKDGRQVTIEVDDAHDYSATVQDPEGRLIGKLEFHLIDDGTGDYLKLCWAYLDTLDESYRFQGIGRECLKRVIKFSGLPIVAESHDGISQDDGSQLTGDAPAFVERMRSEGLIIGREDQLNSLEETE